MGWAGCRDGGGRSLLGAELPPQAAPDTEYTDEELSDEELDDSSDDERREEWRVATLHHRVMALGFHRLFLVRRAFHGLAHLTPCSTVASFGCYVVNHLRVWLLFTRQSSLLLERVLVRV